MSPPAAMLYVATPDASVMPATVVGVVSAPVLASIFPSQPAPAEAPATQRTSVSQVTPYATPSGVDANIAHSGVAEPARYRVQRMRVPIEPTTYARFVVSWQMALACSTVPAPMPITWRTGSVNRSAGETV